MVENFHGIEGGRIHCMVGPQCADMVLLPLLERVFNYAEQKDLLVHMHVAQGERERGQMEKRYGQSTVPFLKEKNFLSGRLLAAHCHDTTKAELRTLAESETRMVSCPTSIAMIDGVVPPLAEYLSLGGKAALGTDQAAGNNNQSILAELKTAALLNKVKHQDPTALKAWQILRLATIEGAEVLGIDGLVSSIERGKKADLVLFDLSQPTLVPKLENPVLNVAHNIVYAARGNEVETVIIDGNIVKRDHEIIALDADHVLSDAQKAAENLSREGVAQYLAANSEMVKDSRKGLFDFNTNEEESF
ncbi:MAG: amidohydrolase family protein [Candidatus Acetothermia bacterium]